MTLVRSLSVKYVLFCCKIRSASSKIPEGHLYFTPSICLSEEQCLQLGYTADLLTSLLDLIERYRAIAMDRTEFSILNAIVLTYSG